MKKYVDKQSWTGKKIGKLGCNSVFTGRSQYLDVVEFRSFTCHEVSRKTVLEER